MNISRPRYIRWVVCVCALVLLIMLSGPATGQSEAAMGFTQDIYQEEQGDVATITVEVQPNTETELTLSGYRYETELGIADRDGDGQVTVQIDTFKTLSEERGSGFSVMGDDQLLSVIRTESTRLDRGNYTLTLAGYSETAQLQVTSPQFGAATSYTLASGTQLSAETLYANVSQTTTVARGDKAVVAFDAEGIEGVGRFDQPPGSNQIVAQNATANTTTNHTVQLSGSAVDTQISQLRIDYRNRDGAPPSNLTFTKLQYIGVDTDGDGRIDQSWEPYVSGVTTNSEGIVTITFASKRSMAPTDQLLLQYGPITNPRQEGAREVTINTGEQLVTGNIEYGYEANGNLGNGLNVAVTTDSSQQFHSSLPFEYVMNPQEDRLYVIMDTTGYDELMNESVTVTLSRAANENFSADETSAAIEITKPTATVELPESRQWDPETGNLSIRGNTTLAPDNKIWIQVRSSERQYSQFLYHYPATISENQTYEVEVEAKTFDEGGEVYIRPINRADGKIGPTKQLIIEG